MIRWRRRCGEWRARRRRRGRWWRRPTRPGRGSFRTRKSTTAPWFASSCRSKTGTSFLSRADNANTQLFCLLVSLLNLKIMHMHGRLGQAQILSLALPALFCSVNLMGDSHYREGFPICNVHKGFQIFQGERNIKCTSIM